MCGRYFFDIQQEELQAIYQASKNNSLDEDISLAYNEVFPSNYVATIYENTEGIIDCGVTRWGFDGFRKGQLLINARVETVTEKKTFKKPFKDHRLVFPMSGFYEWDTKKEKYLFTDSENILYVGGFYRIHTTGQQPIPESIILTTSPNHSVSSVHDRMPLLIGKDSIAEWIQNEEFAKQHIMKAMPELHKTIV